MTSAHKLFRFAGAAVFFSLAAHLAPATSQFTIAEAVAEPVQTAKPETGEPEQAKQRQASTLVLKNGSLLRKSVWGFPVEFTAATGETAGMIRAQIVFPGNDWKYVKFESAPGSRLKVSVKTKKRGDTQNNQELEVTISAGTHVVKNGLIGTLQLMSLRKGETPPEAPVAQLVATAPPETQEVTAPAEKPFDLPPEPPANPSVACFFFSH